MSFAPGLCGCQLTGGIHESFPISLGRSAPGCASEADMEAFLKQVR